MLIWYNVIMVTILPAFLQPFLWSYDLDRLDRDRDKKRIITQILNYGTKEATNWLFSEYSVEEIQEALRDPLAGEWNKRSLNYWSLVLKVESGSLTRDIS